MYFTENTEALELKGWTLWLSLSIFQCLGRVLPPTPSRRSASNLFSAFLSLLPKPSQTHHWVISAVPLSDLRAEGPGWRGRGSACYSRVFGIQSEQLWNSSLPKKSQPAFRSESRNCWEMRETAPCVAESVLRDRERERRDFVCVTDSVSLAGQRHSTQERVRCWEVD